MYGARLRSAIDFPELPPLPEGTVRWQLDLATALPPIHDAVECGVEPLYADVSARLIAHRDGHRVSIDDTGSFDISRDRSRIRFTERPGAWPEFIRAHCLGRVLATAMYLDGWLPLHGSAVAVDGGVIAFLAPKGFGKSSLAFALSVAGARLVTDDTFPVELGARPLAWPGVQHLRLRDDAREGLGASPDADTREGKSLVTLTVAQRALDAPAPLVAIYLLHPIVPPEAGPPAIRTLLPEMLATMSLVSHVKVGRMLGAAAAAALLARSSAVARAVPVFRLETARDLEQLPGIARLILSWHEDGR